MAATSLSVPPGKRLMLAFLAWRNLWRNPVRSGLTGGAIMAGMVMMIVTAALNEGMIRKMAATATELNMGHLQVHREAYVDSQDPYAILPWELVRHLEAATDHAYAPRLYSAGLGASGDFSTGVMLKGVHPEREARVTTLHEHVRAGTFSLGLVPPEPGRERAFPVYDVVIGAQLAKTLRAEVGAELVLITQALDGSIGNGLFRVAGVLSPIEPTLDRMGVLLSLEAIGSLIAMERGVHELAVAARDLRQLDGDQAAIREAVVSWPGELPFAEGGGPVVVRQWKEITPTIADMLSMSNVIVFIITLIIFALVSLGLLNTVLMSVHERRREFGMLLAMGMGRLRLVTMVMTESVLLAVTGGAVGAALGALAAKRLERSPLDFSGYLPDGLEWAGVTIEPTYPTHLTAEHVWIAFVAMLITTLLATLLPSWRTVRMRPASAMHH